MAATYQASTISTQITTTGKVWPSGFTGAGAAMAGAALTQSS
jgi:hypothetical protein